MPYQIGYDTAGRANSFTDQLGRNTQVAYDGAGNQTEVVWPAGTSGTGSYSVTYKYDAMNRMQNVNEGGTNNLLAQYSWDGRWPGHQSPESPWRAGGLYLELEMWETMNLKRPRTCLTISDNVLY
jgi:YD repeat-containing protein